MPGAVGDIYVDVHPSTRGFVSEMAGNLEKEAGQLGEKLGQQIAAKVSEHVRQSISDGLTDGLKDVSSKLNRQFDRQGRDAGERFTKGFTRSVSDIQTELDRLLSQERQVVVDIEVQDDAIAALRRSIDKIREEIRVGVDLDDADLEKLKAELARLHGEEFDLTLMVLTDDHNLDELRRRIDQLRVDLMEAAEVDVDVNTSDIDRAAAEVDGLDEKEVEIPVDVDKTPIDEAGRSIENLGDASERAWGRGRVLNRFQEIGLLITLAFTPAAAAILGLSAAGLAAIAPIAAIAAGLNGIKAAVGPLADDLQRMRSEVSAAFVTGLAPAVGDVGRLMPVLTTGLAGTAGALSTVAVESARVAAEGQNMAQLTTVFGQMNTAVTGLASPIGELIDNIIDFADIGSAAMISLGPLLDQTGAAWDRVIDSLQRTGAGEAAVVALFQALTALLTLAAPLVQLGSSMFAVLGPALAATLNGLAVIVQTLADAFDALPGPIQAALAAAILLRVGLGLAGKTITQVRDSVIGLAGKGANSISAPFVAGAESVRTFRESLDETGTSTSRFTQSIGEVGRRVSDSMDRAAESIRMRIPEAAETAGRALTGPLASAASTAGRAFDQLPDRARRAFDFIKEAPRAALNAVNSFADSTGATLTRWGATVDEGVRTAESAVKRIPSAVASAASAAVNAVNTLADNTGASLTRWGATVDEGIRTGESAVRRFPAVVGTALNSAADATGAALTRWGASLDEGVRRAEDAVRHLPTTIANASRAVGAGFDSMAERLDRVPQSFTRVGDSIGRALDGIPQVVGRATDAVAVGFQRLSTAAESAGRGLSAGLSRAIGGLSDALGGPWGLAISAAIAALSLFGAAQAEAAAKSADFKQSVTDTSTSIREAGGAITENMRNQELFNLSQTAAGDAARTLGENLRDLSSTAIDGGAAWDQLRARLEETARAGQIQADLSRDSTLGLTEQAQATIDAGTAARGLLDQLGPLADKYREAAALNNLYLESIRQSGNSMVMGIGNAAQLTEAFSTLSDEMATTSDRAEALYQALLLLTGGTLPVEQALATMRDSMADIRTAFEEAEKAASKAGVGILDASGNINQATQEGRDLVLALSDVGRSALEAATAAFDAAGGMTNVAAASASAAGVIREQRQAFIDAATAAGLGVDAANRYADQLGLIPELVVTLLRMEGLPQVTQELLQIQGLVRTASIGATIPINASGDALKVLEQVGVRVVQLPEGRVGIVVDDKTAPAIASIMSAIQSNPASLPVNADATRVPGQVAQQTTPLPPAEVPVNANASQVPGQVAQQTTPLPPAEVPVNANTSAVPPAITEVQGIIQAPVNMQIEPGDLEYIRVAVAGIRTTVETPANFSLGVYDNASNLIATIRGKAEAPVLMTIGGVDGGAGPVIDSLRARATNPILMTIGGADAGAGGVIDSLRSRAQAPVLMAIGGVDGGAGGVIDGLRSRATAPTVMPINANDAGARGTLSALAGAVTGTRVNITINAIDTGARATLAQVTSAVMNTTALMKIDADPALANGKLADLLNRVNNSTGTIKVNADTAAAQRQIDDLARPRTTTLTVRIQTIGSVPSVPGGNALGNIWQFAKGGTFNGHDLTPMAPVARIVQANTWRVIGDRAPGTGAEAYIPLNNARRSHALLGTAAARMGYRLLPMATGDLLSVRREQLGTQTAGAFQAGAAPAPANLNARGVEQRLDQIAGLLAERPNEPAVINVEDRSGDPVQTARRVQMALRMSRR